MNVSACPDCQLVMASNLIFGHLIRLHRRVPQPHEDPHHGLREVEEEEVCITWDADLWDVVSDFVTTMRAQREERIRQDQIYQREHENNKRYKNYTLGYSSSFFIRFSFTESSWGG